MEITLEPKIEQEIVERNSEALSLQVIDSDSYTQAGEMLKTLKVMKKHINVYCVPRLSPARITALKTLKKSIG